MKKILLLNVLIAIATTLLAQSDSVQLAPYQRFPGLPPIQILLSDSTTMYTKAQIPSKKPVLIMVFNPECEHCQHETEALLEHEDDFKDVQIVMVMIAVQPLSMMRDFIAKYHLADHPNIVVGKDIYYIAPAFFDIHNIPFLAIYDKKGRLVEGFEGSIGIPKLIETLKGK